MHDFDYYMGLIVPTVNFVIFFALAVYLFRNPLKQLAKKRLDDYQNAFKAANEAKLAAEAKHNELSKKMDELKTVVEQMKIKAKEEAEAESKRIIEEAHNFAEQIRQESKKIAETEINQARMSLRQEIVSAVKENVLNKFNTELNEEQKVSLARKRVGDLSDNRQ